LGMEEPQTYTPSLRYQSARWGQVWTSGVNDYIQFFGAPQTSNYDVCATSRLL